MVRCASEIGFLFYHEGQEDTRSAVAEFEGSIGMQTFVSRVTRLAAGRSVPDLACAAPAWTHEAEGALGASFFVQSCLPTRVGDAALKFEVRGAK